MYSKEINGLQNWKHKISNTAQLGGIETSLIDNGQGRGTRIAWINTGTGLRYKVVIDRAMDIADAFYNHHSLAWLSHRGITSAQPFSNQGADWLRTFGGGLLTTCGLTHVGGPEKDDYGQRGLHDQVSNLPAELESIVQPNHFSGKMDMSITGRVKQSQVLGPNLELKRTISGTIGHAVIKIHDEIINHGNTSAPHMLLYHCNFGWPLVDEGTKIIWNGEWTAGDSELSREIFNAENDFKRCPAPLAAHNGNGEAVVFINISADNNGRCVCGFYNRKIPVCLTVRFYKKQLPWLTNWQHWGNNEYVTGLEPGTHPPVGQANARERGELIFLAPNEMRSYDLEIEVLHSEEQIHQFITNPH